MRCMVIVKAAKDSEKGIMPSAELLAAMGKYNDELMKAGIIQGAGGLRPSSQASACDSRARSARSSTVPSPRRRSKSLVTGFGRLSLWMKLSSGSSAARIRC